MITSIDFFPCNFVIYNKIKAIKVIRSITGWGLKESKDFVDSLANEHRTMFNENLAIKDAFRDTIYRDLQEGGFVFKIHEDGGEVSFSFNLDEEVRTLAKKAIDAENFNLAIKLLKTLMEE